MPQPKMKRGVVSNADAEKLYRAILSTLRETEEPAQLDLLSAMTGQHPWDETQPSVKKFCRAVAKELGL